jgi:hypothetical protein
MGISSRLSNLVGGFEMTVKTTLDMLTDKSVSIQTQRYVEDGGEEYPVGEPHRCAYINSERGREEIAGALAEPYLSAVLTVWGDTPTVIETPPEIPTEEGQ